MMIVGSLERTEAALRAGEIPCPDCLAQLRPRGHARTVRGLDDERLSVRSRRALCAGCGRTRVLLLAALSARRADALEVIGTALAAKAASSGYRTMAALLGGPLSTVRRWLRRVPETRPLAVRAGGAARIPPRPRSPGPSQAVAEPARLELEYIGRCRTRPPATSGPGLPLWTLIGLFTRGNLLSPPLRT